VVLLIVQTIGYIGVCIAQQEACLISRFANHGRAQRAISSSETPNWTVGVYSLQTILLLVAPALYAASVYMMLGRIILLTDGEAHALIRKRWLTKIFVTGDVISFLMQGAG
jgi:hypothetical protein